jgi:rubredoxin
MSSVLDYQQCPQCKFEQADFEYNCRTFEEYLQCRRCGYSESLDREEDSEGKATYKRNVVEGAGVLFYRGKGAIGYTSYFLATQEEVKKAEQPR